MKITATTIFIVSTILFLIGLWPIALLGIIAGIYFLIKEILAGGSNKFYELEKFKAETERMKAETERMKAEAAKDTSKDL